MKKFFLLTTAVCFVLALFLARDSFALLYKYVDKDGVVCFADDLQSVPERYRAKTVIFSGELKAGPKLTAGSEEANEVRLSASPPAGEASAPPLREEKPFGKRLADSIIVMMVLVVIYVVPERLREVIASIRYDKLVSVARIGLSAVAVLYLAFAHVNDVINGVAGVGKNVGHVKEQSARKGRNAAKAIKALDSLLESPEKEEGPSSPASENKE